MEKINLMVCPHDTARKPERWFLFAQYLGKLSERVISFKSSIDFAEFHADMNDTGIIYANPQDSLSLYEDHGFIPLAKPSGVYDEVVFIANKDLQDKALLNINDQQVASVTSMMPTALALKHLQERGISPSDVSDCDSWIAVIRAVSSGKIPYGFVYQDFFDSLNNLSKSTVESIEATLTKQLHHMILLHPRHADFADDLKDILINMHTLSVSSDVMLELGFSQFEAIDATTMDAISAIRAIKDSNGENSKVEISELEVDEVS